jgi:L-2-amino-thiazoline-4-carboxylic acid hydrolase
MDSFGLRLLLWTARGVFDAELGPERTRALRTDAVRALPELVTALPDLGRPGARQFLLATCWLVAVHRALPGRTPDANASLFARAVEHALRRLPRPIVALRRWLFFQPWYHRRLLASIVGGDKTGSFEGQLVPVPGGFGVDYQECALQKFLVRVGHADLGPFVCQLDFLESEVFGLGLTRTGTLMTGAKGCDFRWKRPVRR